MKGWAIYLLIILASCVSVYCYKNKYAQHPNDLEKIEIGLKGIQPFLSPDIRITVLPEYGDKPDVSCMVGYTLAPVKAYMGGNMDTTLFLFPKEIAPDNPNLLASKKMKTIWQNNACGINFILATKQ